MAVATSLAVSLAVSGCSSGNPGDPGNRGPFAVAIVSTGQGQIYPYRIRQVDTRGNPTSSIIDIVNKTDLTANVTANNGVLPVATFDPAPILPSGLPGNQFLLVKFSHILDIHSVLTPDVSAAANSGLTGTLSVVAYDPTTEATTTVRGRAFVGGYTFYDTDLNPDQAVRKSGNSLQVVDPRAAGFPLGFVNDQDLADDHSFVFVPDADGDMSTIETFPTGRIIRILANSGVLDYRQKPLQLELVTSTAVGTDTFAPQILGFSRVNGPYEITPGNGDTNIDPRATVLVKFNKPVQPRDVGAFFSTTNKTPDTRGISIDVTIASNNFQVIYYADPVSVANFCDYVVTPAYSLPGRTPVAISAAQTIRALTNVTVGTLVRTSFTTGEGPGIVNAPVAPEAIYIGVGGSTPGLAVLDLNGFGQGTGDPARSHLVRNPNVGQAGVFPPLFPGNSSLDGGGEGALTLTKDTLGSYLLLRSPIVREVTDMQIGQSLDRVFNNENINVLASRTNQLNVMTGTVMSGNGITMGPHPNPPKLVYPPPNPGQIIFTEEPSSATCVPPPGVGLNNLVTGNPFATNSPGVFYSPLPGAFYGPPPAPAAPPNPLPYCAFYVRQQLGHFLYVLDRSQRQVLAVNSNRMQVLETILLSDPTSMALSPNLKLLAVTNFSSGSVTFIDTDPTSPSFHQVKTEVRVGGGPTGVAWQPEGEDCLVVNKNDSSMSIIGGADLKVRKTVKGLIQDPIDVAVTRRMVAVPNAFNTGLYFAYVLNGNGAVAIYESGPDGANGIGFDDVIGIPPNGSFRRARSIQPDPSSLNTAAWVSHQDENGLGVVSHFELTSALPFPIPIAPSSGINILPPTFRQRDWAVTGRIGGTSPTTPVRDRLSGNTPIDVAFDDLVNFGGLPDVRSNQISNLLYAQHSGKGHLKILPNGQTTFCSVPRFMFIALADTGKLDVFDMSSGAKVRTLDVPGIVSLCNYWRQ